MSSSPSHPSFQLITIDLTQLSFFYLLKVSFWHPKLAMFLSMRRHFFVKLTAVALLLSAVGGIFIGRARIKPYCSDIRGCVEHALRSFGAVSASEEQLIFASEPAEIQSVTLRHLQLHLAPALAEVPAEQLTKSTRQQGVVIARDGISYWQLDPESGLIRNDFSGKNFQLVPRIFQVCLGSPALELNPENQALFTERLVWMLTAAAILAQSFEAMLVYLMCSLIVAVSVTFTMRGNLKYLQGLSVSMTMLIPPFLAALIYMAAGFRAEFATLFVIMFAIYFVYAVINGRRGQVVS